MAKNLENSVLLDFYGSVLGEKQRRIFSLYYDDDLSLSEIAEVEGISRQGVRDAVKRAETQLSEMEEKLGMIRRFQQIQKGIGKIRSCVDRLRTASGPDSAEMKETLEQLNRVIEELEKASD